MRIIVWTRKLRDRFAIRRRLKALRRLRTKFEADAASEIVRRRLASC